MFPWTLEIAVVAAGIVLIALKVMSGVATGMKRKMDRLHEEDPIVNLFAWIDRVMSLRRR